MKSSGFTGSCGFEFRGGGRKKFDGSLAEKKLANVILS